MKTTTSTTIRLIGGAAVVLALFMYAVWWALADSGPFLTNDQIIAETKKCEDAGLKTKQITGGLDLKVKRVQCGEPKK